MQRRRLRMEEKVLDLEFEVLNVQFNECGRYVLTLMVENPLLEDSGAGVLLRVNDGEVLHTNEGSTEPIQQDSLDEVYTCLRSKFLFTLPRGFCKNDKNHDVRLRVEAVRLTDSQVAERGGTRAGEGFFAIFPRTDAPRINMYAGREEELYHYRGTMALLRVHDDQLAMHCGRLAYAVGFHQSRSTPFLSLSPSDDVSGSAWEDDTSDRQTPRVPSPDPSSLRVPPLILGSPRLTNHPTTPGNSPHPAPQPVPQPRPKSKIKPDTTQDASTEGLPTSPRIQAPQHRHEHPPALTPSTPENLLCLLPEDTPSGSAQLHPPIYVTECPPERNEAPRSPLSGDWHVSRPGKGAVSITLHRASSLPPLSHGGVPHPFVIARVRANEDKACGPRGLGVTHCSLQPTHCPSWGERLTVELQDEQARGEELILSVADSGSSELLASYQIPVEHLEPFQHYHLELVQEHSSVPEGVQLYVTLVRLVSALPRLPHFSFTGFEVLLQALERPLREPVGPLVAVARIVPDYASYRDTMMLRTPRAANIPVTSVTFPCPSDSAFAVPLLAAQGHPQVSQIGVPEEQPVWNHCFMFLGRDCATIFTGEAALVLEYYPTTTAMNCVSWHIHSPLGFSSLILDQQLYRKLMSEKGLRVEQLSLQGSVLKTTSDTTPTVGIILRLIGSERPDSLMTAVDPAMLPCLGSEPLEENQAPTIPDPQLALPLNPEEGVFPHTAPPTSDSQAQLQLSAELDIIQWPDCSPRGEAVIQSPACITNPNLIKLQRKGLGLPSYDALAEILPEYQYLFRAPKAGSHHAAQPKPRPPGGQEAPAEREPRPPQDGHTLNETYRLPATHQRNPMPEFEDDPNAAEVTEHQTRELENYRTAMRKMADDIIALRRQVGDLESENSRLRSTLTLHQDLGRSLLDDTDLDVMTKAEIADRIASLKFKLASETSTASAQRDKIQQLQNELIKKNDGAKELFRLQRAHQQQQAVLQRCQGRLTRVAGLEATVRQQEKVIERMEKVLDSKLRGKNKENAEKSKQVRKQAGEEESRRKEIESVLAAENSRLRVELDKLRFQPPPIIIQQPMQTQDTFPDNEKLSLLSRLEKANTRIRTLESQLEENSRHWGRKKQDMLTRLSEHDHGFARTSTMILHDLPLKSASLSVSGPGRRRQLDPLK